jgi:hypothetical protein
MDRDHRSPARQLALVVTGQALVVGALGLAAFRPPVAGVPVLRGFLRWLAAAPPLDALVVVAQRIATVTAAWLLAGALLHVTAAVARRPGLLRVTGRVTLPGVRRAVAALTLSAGVLGAGYPASVAAGAEAPRVRDGRSAPVTTVVAVSPPVSTAPAPTIVVVQAGDSLWSIAERVVATEAGTDVASRWMEICAANAGRLRSGDLAVIYPGEEVVIPA